MFGGVCYFHKPLMVLMSLIATQNVIVFYSSAIFAALGLGVDTTQILTATLQTAAPVGMLAAFYLLPRFGRRPLLVWGGSGQLLFMVLFTILSSSFFRLGLRNSMWLIKSIDLGSKKTSSTQWAAVACLYVYQLINGITWLCKQSPSIPPLQVLLMISQGYPSCMRSKLCLQNVREQN